MVRGVAALTVSAMVPMRISNDVAEALCAKMTGYLFV